MEIWKDIRGFNGNYQVSNIGNIKSLMRSKPIVIKTWIKENGYKVCNLTLKTNNVIFSYVHKEVARAFIPNLDNKDCVKHLDGNKQNNNDYNLEWATNKECVNHLYSIGLRNNKHRHSLTKKQVIAIYKDKLSYRKIMVKYNTNFGSVYAIKHKTIYKEYLAKL